MVQRTDVFVIGGGPAGLAAAIAARKQGFRVTVADGAQPPIDKTCGEGPLPDALAALRELGMEVSASEGYAVQGVRFLGTECQVAARFPAGRAIGMRRPAMHNKLVEQAQACGISLLWKTPVNAICAEGVVAAGEVVAAKWIVGADGLRSRVRRWSGLDGRAKHESRYAFRRHYRVRPWCDFMEIYWGDNAQAYVTPVGEEEVCVVLISRRNRDTLRFARSAISRACPALGARGAREHGARGHHGDAATPARLSGTSGVDWGCLRQRRCDHRRRIVLEFPPGHRAGGGSGSG